MSTDGRLEPTTGASLTPPPEGVKKGKKRVGWHSHNSSRGDLGDEQVALVDLPLQKVSLPVVLAPHHPEGSDPGPPDAFELSEALNKILTNEDEQRLRAHQPGQQQPGQSSASPDRLVISPTVKTPRRPALRRDSSYDSTRDRQAADVMEQRASSRQLSALSDAQFRANRLARSIGSYSAPASRRNSNDGLSPAFQHPGDVSDARLNIPVIGSMEHFDDEYEESVTGLAREEDEAWASPALPPPPEDGSQPRYRFPARVQDALENEKLAEQLVRSHTKKGTGAKRDSLFQDGIPWTSSPSGASTPQDYDQEADYVPRPTRYHGGVLASLLKLYRDAERRGGGGSGGSISGLTTPTTVPSTPVLSPRSSPSSSRPASPTRYLLPGGPGGDQDDSARRRKSFSGRLGSLSGGLRSPRVRGSGGGGATGAGSGLFHTIQPRASRSASSLTLTELMKSSSSMFTAAATSGISDRLTEKIKRDDASSTTRSRKSSSKKDQIRITVHIAGIIARHRYLMKLCRALMMYGAPTHRLEEYMMMSSRVLEIEGQFLYIPSCMIISFDDSTTHTTEVKVVRVPQGIDLGKLLDVHDIYKEVVHDKLGVDEATKRLDMVMKGEAKFPTWFRVFMYGIASASVAPFAFEGRFIDTPVAFFLGCLVGLLQLVFAPSNELYAHVFEVSAAVITSFIARGFGSINGGELFCFSALAQSSIALILPGYMVLCSSLELQSHNIVAGSVRMVYAMIYTLFLGYGITIGASLYGMFDRNATSATHCTAPLSRGWYFLFVPAFTLCLCIVNQAKWSQTPTMLVMALAGFCVNSYSSTYFEGNSQISNMLGALTVGILANLYSRLGRHVENAWLDAREWYQYRVKPRFSRKPRMMHWPSTPSDPESRPGSPSPYGKQPIQARKTGYSLAAAAMLPAIFVQVPSGLAAGGSLLAGIQSANQITGNPHGDGSKASTGGSTIGNLDGTAFNVLFSVIQVAIGISVGLFMSALIVYPLGKRRSGLFSF